MAEVNSNELQAQVLSGAATTVEEAGALLSSYVDLMLDVTLDGGKNRGEKIYALLVATQTQVGRLTTIPDVLMSASDSLSPRALKPARTIASHGLSK